MTEWKRHIRSISDDFGISRAVYKSIISEVEKTKPKTIPVYYESKSEYLYDLSMRKLKQHIRKLLDEHEEVYTHEHIYI